MIPSNGEKNKINKYKHATREKKKKKTITQEYKKLTWKTLQCKGKNHETNPLIFFISPKLSLISLPSTHTKPSIIIEVFQSTSLNASHNH